MIYFSFVLLQSNRIICHILIRQYSLIIISWIDMGQFWRHREYTVVDKDFYGCVRGVHGRISDCKLAMDANILMKYK